MKSLRMVALSGACCNPIFKTMDQELEERIRRIANELGVELGFKTVSIATAALTGLGMGPELGNRVKSLVAKEGMGVLPIVFINGEMVFWGGLPTVERLHQEMSARVIEA